MHTGFLSGSDNRTKPNTGESLRIWRKISIRSCSSTCKAVLVALIQQLLYICRDSRVMLFVPHLWIRLIAFYRGHCKWTGPKNLLSAPYLLCQPCRSCSCVVSCHVLCICFMNKWKWWWWWWCTYVVACFRGYFRCVAGGTCLSSYRRCNGRCDCPYCTDELNCYTPPSSPNITTTYRPSMTTSYQQYDATTAIQPLVNYSKYIAISDAWCEKSCGSEVLSSSSSSSFLLTHGNRHV